MKIKRKIFFFQVKTYETRDKVSVQVWTDSTELQINNSVCEWENNIASTAINVSELVMV